MSPADRDRLAPMLLPPATDHPKGMNEEWQTMAHRGRQNADESLAAALATGQTLRAAAVTAGIAERTAARRWADPDFRRRVAGLRGDLVQAAMGRMADGMSAAADVLRQLLTAQSENVRLGAARSLLELGVKLRETVELEDRFAALEAALSEVREGDRG
jgi:hypothetical protein